MKISKSQRVREFLPSFRPSCLSIILVFVCGVLWLKNEATNDRLFALEKQLTVFTGEYYVLPLKTGPNHTSPKDEAESPRSSPEPLETSVKRSRRHAIDNTTRILTPEDINREIAFQLGRFIPNAYCRSNERVCAAGPPGRRGPTGRKGSRGRRGRTCTRGKKGLQGDMGPPGKSGNSGLAGPAGLQGEKGDKGETGQRGIIGFSGERGERGTIGAPGPRGEKGDMGEPGPKGVPGPSGEPGKTIYLPEARFLSVEVTSNEGENATFQCLIDGNPTPTVYWKHGGVRLLSGLKYSINGGILIIKQLNFSDTGQYSCVVTSIIGSNQSFGYLNVRAAPIFTKRPPSLAMPIESTDFTATCQAEGFPTPVSNWTRLLQHFPLARTEITGVNLTIRNMSTTDSGLYECEVKNNMGIMKTRMNLVVQTGVHCSCWRSRDKTPTITYNYNWRNSQNDAVGFQTSRNIILRGYRLWNDERLFPNNNFTIELYQGNLSVAVNSHIYDSRFSREKTFNVHFSREIYLQAGVNYTAAVRVSGSTRYAAQNVGINNNVCSGVNVVFMKSVLGTFGFYSYVRQIPALIFLSLRC